MERDLSNKKIYQEEEMPESGAGSEFNRKLREEARRKKYGIVLKEFKLEDQPWILKVNGKAGRKWVVDITSLGLGFRMWAIFFPTTPCWENG